MSKYSIETLKFVETSEPDKVAEYIADLEAKLAEKESEVKVGKFWHSAYQGKQLDYDKVYAELRQSYDEIEQLKQQLAEKEKEIEDMKDHQKDLCLRCGGLTHQQYEQDKIDFAVECLLKVMLDATLLGGIVQRETFFINSEHHRSYIQQMIKELKERK